MQAMYAHEGCGLARAAVADGVRNADLRDLARCGAFGKHPQNEQRDLLRLHARKYGAATIRPQTIQLPLKQENRHGVKHVDVPVLAPYELFHHLWTHGHFSKSLLGKHGDDLEHYWEMVLPTMPEHPLHTDTHLRRFTVPIIWFTDGAEFSKSSQSEGVIYEWGSALVDGLNSIDCKFLTSFLVGDTCTSATNDAIVQYMSWAQRVMYDGRFPSHDFYGRPWTDPWRIEMAGRPLAGPYRAAFSAVAHDAKARWQTHKFANYYGCLYICESCFATNSVAQLRWSNFVSGGWRDHRVDDALYLQLTQPEALFNTYPTEREREIDIHYAMFVCLAVFVLHCVSMCLCFCFFCVMLVVSCWLSSPRYIGRIGEQFLRGSGSRSFVLSVNLAIFACSLSDQVTFVCFAHVHLHLGHLGILYLTF
jgi:hypothetical protein